MSHRQPSARAWIRLLSLLAAAVLAGGLLSACGGSGPSHPHSSTSTTRATSRTATTGTGTGTAGTSTLTSTTTSTTAAPSVPIATAEWKSSDALASGQTRARVSIYDLRRQGPFLVLDFGLRCLTAQGCPAFLNTDPHDQIAQDADRDQDGSVSGIVLVDPARAMEYGVVQNAEQYADTSDFVDPTLTPGVTETGWARFALPPASVTSLDVAFPSGGPVFSGLPISDVGAPVLGPGVQRPEPPAVGPTFDPASTRGLRLRVNPLTLVSGSDSDYTSNSATRSSIALRGDVLFHFNRSNLTSRARTVLQSVAHQIAARARGPVTVTGFTDDIGTQAFNVGLSRRRAGTVLGALRKLTHGVRFTSVGRGEADPVATNETAAGRALNRRVTVAFAVAHPQPMTGVGQLSTSAHGSLSYRSDSDTRYRLSIATVRREGRLLLAELNVTCLSGGGCNPEGDLGAGGNTIPPQPNTEAYYPPKSDFQFGDDPAYDTINAFTLLDPDSGQDYLAATDNLVPLTSNTFPEVIPTHHTFQLWAYYPAPPRSTRRLQLLAPVSGVTFKVHSSGRPQVLLPAG